MLLPGLDTVNATGFVFLSSGTSIDSFAALGHVFELSRNHVGPTRQISLSPNVPGFVPREIKSAGLSSEDTCLQFSLHVKV